MKPPKSPVTEPMFRLQIVQPDGTPLTFTAGGQFERDLIQSCREAIMRRGVGILKTEKHVAAAIEAGMKEVLFGLKNETVRLL